MRTAIDDSMALNSTGIVLNEKIKIAKIINRQGNQADEYSVYPKIQAIFEDTDLTPEELDIKTDSIVDDFISILTTVLGTNVCDHDIELHIHKSFGSIDTKLLKTC